MERVERPYDLDLETGLLFDLSIYRVEGRLALPHAPATNLPFTGSVILGATSLQEEHVTVALYEEGHDNQESPALVGLLVRQRTVTHRRWLAGTSSVLFMP